MRASNILETIGNTPHVRLGRLFPDREVWMKLERANPGGSIKDRIGLSMIEDAERRGVLKKDSVIVEPTSGNTGIGLAMVAAVKGYKLMLVMPESMSVERRRILAAYGAALVADAAREGHEGRHRACPGDSRGDAGIVDPAAVREPANIEVHRRTTAEEILRDFPEGIDVLITGVGTGGHITGVSEVLKQKWPGAPDLRGRAGQESRHQRRRTEPAPHPGHRRRVHSRQPAPGHPRRGDPGDRRGGLRHDRPGGEGGSDLHRPVVGGRPGRRGEEAPRAPGGRPRS